MNTGNWLVIILLVTSLSLPIVALANTNDDPGQPPAEPDLLEVEPTYTNAAQAAHAANLAETAAMTPNPETEAAADDLESARESYHDAKQALAVSPDDPALQDELKFAEQDLETARKAYAEAVGALSGVLGDEVYGMRQNGMGWGQIAKELGVHPGALGLGHGKKLGEPDLQVELTEATVRDQKSGWSKGHGLHTSGEKSSKKGLGLSKTSAQEGVAQSSGKKAGKSNSSSSKSTGASKSNNGRGSDGGPSGSSGNSGGNGKDKDKSSKSNNGKAKGKDK